MTQRRSPIQLSEDFNWQDLYDRLDEDARSPEMDPKLAETVTRLLQLFLPGVCSQLSPEQVGLRVIALAWVLNPGYFRDIPSLREVARQCAVPKSTFARLARRISMIIGWRNHTQHRSGLGRKVGHSPHG